MILTLEERVSTVKSFYLNDDSSTEAFRKFLSLKWLRKCPLAQVVDDVATQGEEERSQIIGSTSIWRIAASVDQPRSTFHQILQKVFRYCPYKQLLNQQILPDDLDSRQTFALWFLALVEFQGECPWKSLGTDKAHFHMEGVVYMRNCRIWTGTNLHQFLEISLHSSHITANITVDETFSYDFTTTRFRLILDTRARFVTWPKTITKRIDITTTLRVQITSDSPIWLRYSATLLHASTLYDAVQASTFYDALHTPTLCLIDFQIQLDPLRPTLTYQGSYLRAYKRRPNEVFHNCDPTLTETTSLYLSSAVATQNNRSSN
ncbi:uncharacterized protein TNCV_4408871 [Trichonephila clavipes]|nr:uncharacterized protein TNCV_4408871 [Trichonephila clavipes]